MASDPEWTVSIDDTSSFINYLPHGDGGVGDWTSTGWQPWFSGSGGFIQSGGEYGSGTSMHLTAFSGAQLNFQFYGASVALYGQANCSYVVSVDGASNSLNPTNGPQLFKKDGMNEQMHTLSLTASASNSSMFAFDRADVSRTIPEGSAGVPRPTIIPATDTGSLKYAGSWVRREDPNGQIPSKQDPGPYYEVTNGSASVSFSFQGSAVAVNGSRNWGSYTYDVALDGNSNSYNASTMWLIGDALLFYEDGLDPKKTHNVTVTPKVGGGQKFWFNSVTVYSAASDTTNGTTPNDSGSTGGSSPSSSGGKKTNVGAIVGGVVGGIAALLIFGGIFGLWWWRRRKQRQSTAATAARLSPFAVAQPPAAAAPSTDHGPSEGPLMRNANVSASQVSKLARYTAGGASSQPDPPGSATGSAWSASSQSAPLIPPASGSATQSGSGAGESSGSQPAPDQSAAVDRLIQIIADRIDRDRSHGGPARSEYGSDVPPPQYHEL
ncbi:hypothetical protein C8Q78DRAFT_1076611 [Trametes maxima]|nr:hypothetical protein C8Q78DRAFT_1076611 [Trametes maxima]